MRPPGAGAASAQIRGRYTSGVTSLAFTMSLHAARDGKLHAEFAAPEERDRFTVSNALLVLRLWTESPDVIRCSLHHPLSGAIAYLQGNHELAQLSEAIGLELNGERTRSHSA
jgi:hypothetical protein